MRSLYKKMAPEDRFARKYACWAVNHGGFAKYKRQNRRLIRKKLQRNLRKEFQRTGEEDA